MDMLAPVARLFFQSAIATMQSGLPEPDETLPFLLLLDEFKSLGKMEAVSNATGTLRQFGGHMLIVVQGLSNLDEVYDSAGAQSLMNACQVHAFMSINDPATKEMISRSLGNHGVETSHESTSRQFGTFGGSTTRSAQTRASKLLPEEAVNRMGEDAILLIAKDARPIRARKVKYYEDLKLKKLAGGRTVNVQHVETNEFQAPDEIETAVAEPLVSRAHTFLLDVEGAKASLMSQAA